MFYLFYCTDLKLSFLTLTLSLLTRKLIHRIGSYQRGYYEKCWLKSLSLGQLSNSSRCGCVYHFFATLFYTNKMQTHMQYNMQFKKHHIYTRGKKCVYNCIMISVGAPYSWQNGFDGPNHRLLAPCSDDYYKLRRYDTSLRCCVI